MQVSSPRLLRVAVPLVVAVGVASVAIGASWQSTPTDLSAPGETAAEPQVAVDSTGTATAVWYRFDGTTTILQGARMSGGAWSASADISAPGRWAYAPRLVVDAAGVPTAVWRGDVGNWVIQASRFVNGAWSPPVNLSDPGRNAFLPEVAAAADGVLTAVWHRFNGSDYIVQASRFSGGTWSTPVNLSAPSEDAELPRVAVDAAGGATVVWRRFNGANWIIQASRFTAGAWSAPVDLSASLRDANNPAVAVDPSGNAVAVWDRDSGSSYSTIQAARFSGGTWGTATNLSIPPRDSTQPVVAVDASGVATVVWRGDGPTFWYETQAVRSSGGTWSSPTKISATGAAATTDPAVTVDAAGTVTAVWLSFGGVLDTVDSARFSGGSWSPAVQLSASGGNAMVPSVATNDAGVVAAAWARSNGANDIAQVSVFRVTPSAPRNLAVSAGDGTIAASWGAPLLDGGAAITSYTATATPGGQTCTSSAAARACTLSNLTNGTEYTVSVSAVNSEGPGPAATLSATPVGVQPAATSHAALTASVLPSQRRVRAGQRVRIGIRVANVGNDVASSATTCVRLPSALVPLGRTPGSAAARQVCFPVSALGVGGSVTRQVTVRAVATRQLVVSVGGTVQGRGVTSVRATPVGIRITPSAAWDRVAG